MKEETLTLEYFIFCARDKSDPAEQQMRRLGSKQAVQQ